MKHSAIRTSAAAFLVLTTANTADAQQAQQESDARANVAGAATIAVPDLRGDVEYGAYLAGECTTCHQTSLTSNGIPSIIGWREADFARVLHAYRQGVRDHPVMQMIASQLGNTEIAALAAYFATVDP